VLSARLTRPDGAEPARVATGSHIELRLPSGRVRQYSLSATRRSHGLADRRAREPAGRGGSLELPTSPSRARPSSYAARATTPPCRRRVLPLPGRWNRVTPILAMGARRRDDRRPFSVVYGGRTRGPWPSSTTSARPRGRVDPAPQDEHGLPTYRPCSPPRGPARRYCCGPAPMIAAVERALRRARALGSLHVERSRRATISSRPSTRPRTPRSTCTGALRAHDARPPDKRLIEVLQRPCPGSATTARRAIAVRARRAFSAGRPRSRLRAHEDERAAGRTMMICVGRCKKGDSSWTSKCASASPKARAASQARRRCRTQRRTCATPARSAAWLPARRRPAEQGQRATTPPRPSGRAERGDTTSDTVATSAGQPLEDVHLPQRGGHCQSDSAMRMTPSPPPK